MFSPEEFTLIQTMARDLLEGTVYNDARWNSEDEEISLAELIELPAEKFDDNPAIVEHCQSIIKKIDSI